MGAGCLVEVGTGMIAVDPEPFEPLQRAQGQPPTRSDITCLPKSNARDQSNDDFWSLDLLNWAIADLEIGAEDFTPWLSKTQADEQHYIRAQPLDLRP